MTSPEPVSSMTPVTEIIDSSRPALENLLLSYLAPENPQPEDFNLLEALKSMDLESIGALANKIETVQHNGGRVFTAGNGGSYDNAKLIALLLGKSDIKAQTPGSGQEKVDTALENGYDLVFSKLLERNHINENDLLITISGSGNSPNVLEALKVAQKYDAQVATLGGRDGGEMCQMAGLENSCIIKSEIMEIIEDGHATIAFILGELFSRGKVDNQLLKEIHQLALETIKQLTTPENVQGLAETLQAIEKTLVADSRVIFIGSTIGSNHIRADLGRGATNMLPIALNIPEAITSSNAAMATSNDDGPEYVYVHALQNLNPNPNDLIVVLNSPSREEDNALQHCIEEAEAIGCSAIVLGDDLHDQKALVKQEGSQMQFELFSSILADLCGRTLNTHLIQALNLKINQVDMQQYPPEIQSWLGERLNGNKQLSRKETIEFESILRQKNLLDDDKVVTYCYGQMFTVNDPTPLGLKRKFY